MRIEGYLERMVGISASDLHIRVGAPAVYRANEALYKFDEEPLPEELVRGIVEEVLSEEELDRLRARREVDVARSYEGIGRFRMNVHLERGRPALAIRRVYTEVLGFEQLHLPPVFERICAFEHGLVLVCGPTSSGKSTTQAAMIDYINETRACHIVTIEDPIEFIHRDKTSIITQREVGIDTESFATAMKYVVRQDPDVILIGEMRDAETFEAAISASETGHLVISTLHTMDAMQSVDRLMDFFPAARHDQIRALVAMNLRAITCQRLVARADGQGLIPAVEVMINTPAVAKLIRENRVTAIPAAIAGGAEAGMQTFNQSLASLYRSGFITFEEALANSSNPDALRMNLQGIFLDEERRILGDE